MKNRPTITRLFAMTGIILSLLVGSVPVQAAESVATQGMRLSKTQGIVTVFDTANKPQKATGNMKLLSGYNIATSASSYAWVNLDDNKLVKMDALSKVKVTSTGKNHVVDVVLGKAFVDVSKDLDKDESLVIRTSSVVTSINKGTSAEIRVENGKTTIVGLDGKLDCLVADVTKGELKSVEVLSGKKVEVKPTASGISVVTKASKKDDISGFSKLQIAQDSVLKDRIIKASGSKIGNISVADAVTAVSQDMVRQAAEVIAMANESGKDVQSVINTMVGSDISTKTLESANAATQSAPSSSTENVASSSSSSASDNASESSESLSIYPFAGNGFAWGGDLAAFVSDGSDASGELDSSEGDGSDTGERSDSPVNVHVHSWDEGEVTREATCNSDGIKKLTCRTCHKTKEVTIPAAHTLVDPEIEKDVTEGTPDNCQEYIIAIYKHCEKCDQDIEQSTRDKYAGHDFGEWYPDEEHPSTCTEAGMRKHHCTRVLDSGAGKVCTYFEEESNPEEPALGHLYNEDVKDFRVNSVSYCYSCPCTRERCEYGDSKGHTLGGAIPSTKEADPLYIHCAESDCNYSAEYKWTEGKGYVSTGKWVVAP